MRQFKFDNYVVTAKTASTNSNYDLSVKVYKDKILHSGTIMKRGSSDLQVLDWAIQSIKNPTTFEL